LLGEVEATCDRVAFVKRGRVVHELSLTDAPAQALEVELRVSSGTRFTTVTNGMVAFAFFGLAFIGGWVEQIGSFVRNDTARCSVPSAVMIAWTLGFIAVVLGLGLYVLRRRAL
jgi:hypothetical protein